MRSGEPKPKLNPKTLSDEPHPLGTVSPLRFLTISWLTPLLRLGATKEQLSPDDVWHLRHRDRAAPLGARFDHAMQSSRGSRRVPRTLAALWRCFHRAYLLISLHWVVFVISQLMAPRLLGGLLLFLRGAPEREVAQQCFGVSNGYALAVLLGGIMLVTVLCVSQAFVRMYVMACNVRSCVMHSVFAKALRLHTVARQGASVGQMVNLMSNDAERIYLGLMMSNQLWVGPLMISLCMTLLVLEIGVSGIVATVLMLCYVPIQGKLARKMGRLKRSMLKLSDKRVMFTNEALVGIRVVKMYGWEDSIEARIAQLRSREMTICRSIMYHYAANQWLLFITPVLVAGCTFLVYIALGNELEVSTVYTVFAILNIINIPLAVLPKSINMATQAMVGINRLDAFLAQEEMMAIERGTADDGVAVHIEGGHFRWTKADSNPGDESSSAKEDDREKPAPLATAGGSKTDEGGKESSSKNHADETFELKGINLTVKRGALVAIIGRVGSGKSSLVAAMLSEMHKVAGTVAVHARTANECSSSADAGAPGVGEKDGTDAPVARTQLESELAATPSSVGAKVVNADAHESCMAADEARAALVAQEPWICNASIRDNVCFGAAAEPSFNAERYNRVLDAAQLRPDLDMLPAGDQTEIGERGINLSGGQKARVSLARAVYLAPSFDLFIFDDPLAAVDVHVGRALFEQCILGELRDKTRIVVLNSHLHLLRHVDNIIIMEHGRIAASGTLSDLRCQWAALLGNDHADAGDSESERAAQQDDAPSAASEDASESSGPGQSAKIDTIAIDTAVSTRASGGDESSGGDEISGGADSGALYALESRVRGRVRAQDFAAYLGSATTSGDVRSGRWILAGLLALFVAGQCGRTGSEWWLGEWASGASAGVTVYVVVAVATFGVTLVRTLYFARTAIRCATNLHDKCVTRVLNAPINLFFDVCPTGRIINRFASDVDRMDIELPETLENVTQNTFRLIACFAVCASTTPWVLLCLCPIAWAFTRIFKWFRPSSREIKRMEGVSRSPIFQGFTETLQGLCTIRAFGMTREFLRRNERLVDENARLYMTYWMCGRWLGTRLDLLSVATALAVSILSVVSFEHGLAVNRVLTGLALVYAMQLAGMAQFTARQMIETESHMVSVERLNALRSVPQEKQVVCVSEENCKGVGEGTSASDTVQAVAEHLALAESWPSRGTIEFRKVTMRYRPGLELVLRQISFAVPERHKVGICGRTGSGKSSVMAALLRVVEIEAGSILIDGIDTKQVPLRQLRKAISIIPQEPVLFSGTVRMNLDPFDEHNDEALWAVLERACLADTVRALPQRLGATVTENGGNYSVGQRQLICIARALLRNSRLVLLDEATASVDSETDALIQQAIGANFGEQTVLTIAHRIQTIANSDSVLVLDDGKVAEYDKPDVLLQRPSSLYYSLVHESLRQQRELQN